MPATTLPRTLTIFIAHCLYLTDHLPLGEGLVTYGFISELAKRGHRLIVATPHCELAAPAPAGVEIHLLEASKLGYLLRVRRLFNDVARRERIDIIHQFNPVARGMALSLLGSGIPLVLGTQTGDWPNGALTAGHISVMDGATSMLRTALDTITQLHARALLLTSPYALRRLALPKLLRQRIFEVPHGVDTNRFRPPIAREGPPTILYVASLARHKGIFVLLQAFDIVAQRLPEARLRIVGGRGADKESVLEACRQSAFSDRIEIAGNVQREALPSELCRARVCCLPAYGEPYPQSVLEAMSAGLPIVATDTGGIRYLVPRSGALIVPEGDATRLAEALLEILASPEKAKAMGEVNRGAALQRHSWPHVIDVLESVYGRVLGMPVTAAL